MPGDNASRLAARQPPADNPHIAAPSATTAELCTQGVVVCVVQIIITTALPLIEYFFVYRGAQYLIFIPIMNWSIMIVSGILGILALLTRTGHYLGLHACLATALGAGVASVNIFSYVQLRNRCETAQFSFAGCANCPCAQTSICKQDDISACKTGCKALGTDTCSLILDKAYIVTFTGALMLLAAAVPVAYSLLVLARTEYQRDKMANELMFRRTKVAAVYRDLIEGKGPRAAYAAGLDPELLQIMLGDMLKYGTDPDKALARATNKMLTEGAHTREPTDPNARPRQTVSKAREGPSPLAPPVEPPPVAYQEAPGFRNVPSMQRDSQRQF